MQSFWGGFEKKADKKARTVSGLVAPIAGGAVAGTALYHLMGLAEKMQTPLSENEARSFAEKIIKAKGLKTTIVFGGVDSAGYDPHEDKIHLPEDPTLGEIAHELGHAASVGRLARTGKLGRTVGDAVNLLNRGSLYLPSVTNMPLAGLLAAAPGLLEEMSASGRALGDLKKHEGSEAMAKAIPALALGFGSYAARPAVAGYLTKRMNS